MVVVIKCSAGEDIGDEFQECGFSGTSLSNKKDGARRFRPVLRFLDYPHLKRLYVARRYDQDVIQQSVLVTYLIVESSSSGAFSAGLWVEKSSALEGTSE